MSSLLFAVYVAFAGGHRVPLATEDRLPAVDPQGTYRMMTAQDATSSSTCIGRNDLPLCTVETVLACVLRGSDELCRRGLGDGAPRPENEPEAGRTIRYRIEKVDVLGYPPHAFPHTRVGDLAIQVASTPCKGSSCDAAAPTERNYFVGKRGGAWHVFGWTPVAATN